MFNSFKALKAGKLGDPNLIYPLVRWCAASQVDLPWCQEINKYLFFIDKKIAMQMLSIGLRDKNTYIKYPKALKESTDKTFELKKNLLKQYYSWSEQEFERNISMLDYVTWEEVARSLGCDKKERKVLGLTEIKTKKVKKEIKKAKTLFDF